MVITCSIFFSVESLLIFVESLLIFVERLLISVERLLIFMERLLIYFTITLNYNLSGVTGQGNTVFHARKQRFLAKKTLFSQW